MRNINDPLGELKAMACLAGQAWGDGRTLVIPKDASSLSQKEIMASSAHGQATAAAIQWTKDNVSDFDDVWGSISRFGDYRARRLLSIIEEFRNAALSKCKVEKPG